MKKTIVLLFFALFLSFYVTVNNQKVNASSSNINDLSCANGKNLLDKNNIEVENINNNISLTTKNNIFLPASDDDEMVIQLSDNSNYYYDIAMRYAVYDIDGAILQSEFYDESYFSTETVEGEDVLYAMFTIYSENAFSLSFTLYGVLDSFVNDEYPGFMITHTYEPTKYEEYINRAGLFEITSESEATIYVAHPNTLTTSQILSLISAKDAYYGDLIDDLEITVNEYEGNELVLGKYEIEVSISDSSNNSQSGQFFIEVIDIEAPVIVGEDLLRIPIGTRLSHAYLLARFSASDAYDGDLTSSMTLLGEYSFTPMSVYEEHIQIQVSDSSNNTTTKDVTLSYYDNQGPTIDAPSSITLGYQVRKPVSDIISDSVVYQDYIDPNPTLFIEENTYSGNENKIGDYYIKIRVTDASNNSTYKTINITVEDTIKPVIYIDLGVIETLSSVVLRVEDVSNILYKSGELKKLNNYKVEVIKDTYTGHETTPGEYALRLRYTSNSESLDKTFKIKVTSDSYKVDTYTPKIDNKIIVFTIITSILSISLITISICFVVKTKKSARN